MLELPLARVSSPSASFSLDVAHQHDGDLVARPCAGVVADHLARSHDEIRVESATELPLACVDRSRLLGEGMNIPERVSDAFGHDVRGLRVRIGP